MNEIQRYNMIEIPDGYKRVEDPEGFWVWYDDHQKIVKMLMDEIINIKAERDVWSGEACKQEQEAGNGPCGACRYCYPEKIKQLKDALDKAGLLTECLF